jgi:hypothetical protein
VRGRLTGPPATPSSPLRTPIGDSDWALFDLSLYPPAFAGMSGSEEWVVCRIAFGSRGCWRKNEDESVTDDAGGVRYLACR